MKRFDKATIFLVPAGVLALVGIFARQIGLSEMTGLTIFLAALLFFLIGYREAIKARESVGEKPQSLNPKL